jgi:hypothetical protein
MANNHTEDQPSVAKLLAALNAQLQDQAARIDELEQAVFLAEDGPIDEVDELEAAHLQFAGVVRARREGSA